MGMLSTNNRKTKIRGLQHVGWEHDDDGYQYNESLKNNE